MAPAVGILVARLAEDKARSSFASYSALRLYLPLIPALVIALMVTRADFQHAA
jgi:hypothetical protein